MLYSYFLDGREEPAICPCCGRIWTRYEEDEEDTCPDCQEGDLEELVV